MTRTTTRDTTTVRTSVTSLTLDVADPAAADAFYAEAFSLGSLLRVRQSDAPTAGFRGFAVSLMVAQPANVNAYLDAALAAGATALKPAARSLFGYGGVVEAPDGTIFKVATAAKKDSGPATRAVDHIVLLLGAGDVAASKQRYLDHGLTEARSFGRKYVEFHAGSGPITLALYGRRALAKDVGVAPDGSGSHRLVIHGAAVPFADPDQFTWTPETQ